jgi:hypothetical protein
MSKKKLIPPRGFETAHNGSVKVCTIVRHIISKLHKLRSESSDFVSSLVTESSLCIEMIDRIVHDSITLRYDRMQHLDNILLRP